MAKTIAPLLPSTAELLQRLGDRLRAARLRRNLTAKQVAERTGMSAMTLRGLERGGSGVTMGAYLSVMQVLGIENDLDLLGKADPVGRDLQDANLASKRKKPSPPLPAAPRSKTRKSPVVVGGASPTDAGRSVQPPRPADAPDWITQSEFANSESLAGLITRSPSSTKKRR